MLKFILILFLGYINFYTTHATTIATVTLIETLGHGFQDNSEDFKPLTERSTICLPLEWQTETRSMKTSVNYSVRLKGVSIFPHISLIRIRDLCINCSHLRVSGGFWAHNFCLWLFQVLSLLSLQITKKNLSV